MTRRLHPRLLSACLVLALLVATGGCSLLDTINRLPGTLGGKTTRAQVDYITTDDMRTAMQVFTDTVGADTQVVSLQFSRDVATMKTKDKGSVQLRYGESRTMDLTPPLPVAATVALSSLDPVAARDRMVAKTSCASPTALSLVVEASGVITTNLFCGRGATDPIYTQIGDSEVLRDVDLTTSEGIATAWGDIQRMLPPDEGITTWGITFSTKGGQMIAGGVNTTTVRFGIQNERDSAVISQSYHDPSSLNSVKASEIKMDVVAAGHATAMKECGKVTAVALQVPATSAGRPWLSFSDLGSCVVATDLAGNRV